jgi:imidazolonepropionase-like amidohydrolase
VRALAVAWLSLTAAALAAGAPRDPKDPAAATYVVKAQRIHVSPGEVLPNGMILVQGGKIVAVGPTVDVPSGAVTLEAVEVTSGLIEANASAGRRDLGIEDSSEITPNYRAVDGLEPDSVGFERLARRGVGTAWVGPSNRNVVGGLAAVVKTVPANPNDPGALRVVAPDADLKVAFGDEPMAGNFTPRGFGLPQNFHVRRPGSRPGVVMEMRMAFLKAQQCVGKLGIVPEDLKPLVDVFERNLPVRAHAYFLVDLRSCLRVAKEFGVKNLTIDGAFEAHRCLPELKAAGAKLVIGPHAFDPMGGRDGRGRGIDFGDVAPAADLLARVAAAGIPVALSAAGAPPDDDLVSQMRTAVRFGATKETALRAVTSGAAEVLGIADRVGSIAVGRDGDLVLWSGDPFELTTRIVGVLVDGNLVPKTTPAASK